MQRVCSVVPRNEGDERAHGKRSQSGAQQAAHQGDQETIGKQLAAEAHGRGAQSKASADLALARRTARQEEASDVQAGKAKENGGDGKQDP